MKFKNKIFTLTITIAVSLPSIAFGGWYVSKVVEVSTRSDTGSPVLYIKTEANPNPNNCVTSWSGAQWNGSGTDVNLAASIALSAKATGSNIRFSIDETSCSVPSGNPTMTWIQLQ